MKRSDIGLRVITAFILMIFALYDNYPIVTNDTGTYIESAFGLVPPADRPIFYGLFIRATSLGLSLWLTAFVQSLLLSYSIIGILRKVVRDIPAPHIIALVLFTSLFTTAGWYSGQIMPDIFVSIMALCITRYVIFKDDSASTIILLSVIYLATLTHNSNYIIIVLFSGLILISSIFFKQARQYLSKAVILFSIAAISWFSLCTSNYIGNKGFVASTSSHVFIMGKLAESGILKKYLDETCTTRPNNICAFKDSLPATAWEFHWSSASPLQKTGGWDANKDEYNKIIDDIVSRPKYWGYMAYKSMEATMRQVVLTNIDGSYALPWMVFDQESQPYIRIHLYYSDELNEFKMSRQNTKAWNIGLYNAVFAGVIILSILICLFVIRFDTKETIQLYTIILLLIILNAFTTASLSSVNERLNSRMIWLLPFLNVIFIYKYLYNRYLKRKNESK